MWEVGHHYNYYFVADMPTSGSNLFIERNMASTAGEGRHKRETQVPIETYKTVCESNRDLKVAVVYGRLSRVFWFLHEQL